MRAESAVEPTKSENITVTWRRSARSSGGVFGALDVVVASPDGVLPLASLGSAAMASSSFTRCPSDVTPSSFRFSCVRLGRTVSSMSFSRNAASYFPRPKLRSQTTMSMTGVPQLSARCKYFRRTVGSVVVDALRWYSLAFLRHSRMGSASLGDPCK